MEMVTAICAPDEKDVKYFPFRGDKIDEKIPLSVRGGRLYLIPHLTPNLEIQVASSLRELKVHTEERMAYILSRMMTERGYDVAAIPGLVRAEKVHFSDLADRIIAYYKQAPSLN